MQNAHFFLRRPDIPISQRTAFMKQTSQTDDLPQESMVLHFLQQLLKREDNRNVSALQNIPAPPSSVISHALPLVQSPPFQYNLPQQPLQAQQKVLVRLPNGSFQYMDLA